MRTVVVTDRDFTDFILENMYEAADADLILFGFGCIGRVDFTDELSEEKSRIYDLALLSENLGCTVAACAETCLMGAVRKSVIVCDKGGVLGISDATFIADGVCVPGFGYRVYDTRAGMFGAVICDDVRFLLPSETIANACGEFMLLVTDKSADVDYMRFARAACTMSGIGALAVTASGAFCVTPEGEASEVLAAGVNKICFSPYPSYSDVEIKVKKRI